MEKEIKIKTPYGIKNWSYVKKVFDSHAALVEVCQKTIENLEDFVDEHGEYRATPDALLSVVRDIRKALEKA